MCGVGGGGGAAEENQNQQPESGSEKIRRQEWC